MGRGSGPSTGKLYGRNGKHMGARASLGNIFSRALTLDGGNGTEPVKNAGDRGMVS